MSGTSKWAGGVLAQDGKIFGIPHDAARGCLIDPTASTVSTISVTAMTGTSLSGSAKWLGGVIAPNFEIYGLPYNATGACAIKASIPNLQPWMLGPQFNKL